MSLKQELKRLEQLVSAADAQGLWVSGSDKLMFELLRELVSLGARVAKLERAAEAASFKEPQ